MNFYITISVLLLMIFLSIFKSYRLRTSDKILLLLNGSRFGFMSISWTQFFSFFTNIFSQIL